MSDKNQEQENSESVTDNHTDIDKSKRKFSKVGMAAPVVMILANRPAWGNANTQCQVSGFNSLSVNGNQVSGVVYDPDESCGTQFDWASNANRSNWFSPYLAVDKRSSGTVYRVYALGGNTDYSSLAEVATANPGRVFKVSDIFSSFSGNKTIYDAIRRVSNTNATAEQIFLGDMLSLYFSRINGSFTALTETQIIDLYDAFKGSGSSYTFVSSGIIWTRTEFDDYLEYLKGNRTPPAP